MSFETLAMSCNVEPYRKFSPRSLGGRLSLVILCATAAFVANAQAEDFWPDLSSPPIATGGGEKDAAVIVGAEKYAFVEPVPGARANADAWQAYLTETLRVPAENVALLRDDDATNDEMRQAAVDKATQVEPGGTLWFVFIGHGAPSKDGKDGLLVGVDAQGKAESVYKRSLSRNELLGLLAKGKQEKTVVLVDASFSGKAPSGRDLVANMQPLVPTRNLPQGLDTRTIIITAARSDQFAGALPNAGKPRPAFSYLALGALRGWAADASGRVTVLGIVDYAKKALSLVHDRTQTPELVAGSPGAVLGKGHEGSPDMGKIDLQGSPSKVSEATVKPASVTIGKAGIEWVTIPAGTFMMGSSAQPHRVTLKSFQIAKTPVTNKQYRACEDAGACSSYGWFANSSEDEPVVWVNWDQAQSFSKWVGGRLPSEAEWEYAARSAGKNYKYPSENAGATCEDTVISGCQTQAETSREQPPKPVCSRPKGNTEQGLCDMAGNVSQWVQDWYHYSGDPYDGAPTDGSAWEMPAGTERVIRGRASGGYDLKLLYGSTAMTNEDGSHAWSEVRGYKPPAFRGPTLGFRPLRDTATASGGVPDGWKEKEKVPKVIQTGKAGIQWVKIPAGRFTMVYHQMGGAPAHSVTIEPFQMAETLVTNKQYKACVAANACTEATSMGSAFEGDDQPVVGVDWNQANAFSKWVGGRLPTAAEWEYVARSATLQGLCDMTVYAGEWVQDWDWIIHGRYSFNDGWHDTSALRDSSVPNLRIRDLGFRPVRSEGASESVVKPARNSAATE